MNSARKGVVWFLLLAFGLAWIAWAIPIGLDAPADDPLLRLVVLQLAGLRGGLAPALAAIIVRRWITREGFADAGLGGNFRAAWPLYLFAWLWPLLGALIITLLATVLGAGPPDWTFQSGTVLAPGMDPSPSPGPAAALILPLEMIAVALPATFVLWGEEFGWRGYLQPRLWGHRPLLAAVATGLIWGAWHFPFFFLPHYGSAGRSWLVLPVFCVSTVLLSIMFGWLYRRSGSIWVVSLAHASVNCIGSTLTSLWLVNEPNTLVWGFLGAAGWVPLGMVCAWLVLGRQFGANPET